MSACCRPLGLIAAAALTLGAAEPDATPGADEPLAPAGASGEAGIQPTAVEPTPEPAAEPAPAADPAPAVNPDADRPVYAESTPVPARWRKKWTLDLRAMLGTGAGITQLEDDDDEVDINAGTGGHFRVLTLWGYRPGGKRVGFQLGGGLAFGGHGGDVVDENDLSYSYAAFEFTGGLLVVPTPGLQLEVRPFVRLGGGELDIDEDISGVDEDDIDGGGYVAGGLSAGMWYAFGNGFQLGGELGLEAFAGTSEIQDETVTVSGGGAFGAAGVGYRW